MEKDRNNKQAAVGRTAEEWIAWGVAALFVGYTIYTIIYQFVQGDWLTALKGLMFPLFLLVPLLFKWVGLRHCWRLYAVVWAFCIFAFSYGCIYGAFAFEYSTVIDKISHFLSGFLFTIVGFCLYYWQAPRAGESLRQAKGLLAGQFAFFFSMAVAAVWEVAEFFDYNVFGNDSQNHETTGVFDTMQDMIACLVASLVSVVCFAVYKKGGPKLFTAWLVEEFYEKNAGRAGKAGAG